MRVNWILLLAAARAEPAPDVQVFVDFSQVIRTSRTVTTLQAEESIAQTLFEATWLWVKALTY